MRVTLIQCTNKKNKRCHKARYLYEASTYFCKMRDWARSTGNPWYILSAKHGLVHPDTVLSPYDERGLSVGQCREIAKELDEEGVTEVEMTAGKDYTDPLTPELERKGIDVIEVCRGMMIGQRMAKLKEITEANNA